MDELTIKRAYRVEKDGTGPYFGLNWDSSNLRREMGRDHSDNTHPAITEDYCNINNDIDTLINNLKYKTNMICGFESLNLLKEWFGIYLTGLFELGYEIYEYDVKLDNKLNYIVSKSKRQILFNKNETIFIKKYKL